MTRIRITRVTDDAEIARQLVPHMRNLGQALGARMQRLVPKRTFALNDTIATDTEARGAKVVTEVGFGDDRVRYGLLVERGTSRMAAQPFARPALLQTKTSDLAYSGQGIRAHGIVPATSRARRRERGGS